MTCATHTPPTAKPTDASAPTNADGYPPTTSPGFQYPNTFALDAAAPTTTNREQALTAIHKANLLGNVLHDDLYSICARPNATPGSGTVLGLLAVAAQIRRRVDACILALVEFQAEAYLDQGKP